jgi:hypothetical protein
VKSGWHTDIVRATGMRTAGRINAAGEFCHLVRCRMTPSCGSCATYTTFRRS